MRCLVVLFAFYGAASVVKGSWFKPTSYYRTGDIIMGGMFPLHYRQQRTDNYDLLSKPTVPVCTDYNFHGFRWMMAMLFAIEEINNSSTFLPNVKFGWKLYDTCYDRSRSVSHAFDVITSGGGNYTNKSYVDVVLGASSSDNSIAVAGILGIFDIPQISYSSTSKTLSDKHTYNSFLRTIPNDDEQAKAIVDLLEFYNWTWVGGIGGDNEYGRRGMQTFKKIAHAKGICIEFEEYVEKNPNEATMESLAKRIRDFNATVFVAFISRSYFKPLAVKLREKGVTGKIWIGSESWASSAAVLEKGGQALHGSLGVAIRGGPMRGFKKYLESIHPPKFNPNPFIIQFWEETFNCSCTEDACGREGSNRIRQMTGKPAFRRLCTGDEPVTPDNLDTAYLVRSDDEIEKSYFIYLAVHAVANAVNDISNCVDGGGLLKDGKCPHLKKLEPWQLLAYIKNVSFDEIDFGKKFEFDSNGDSAASYKLVSWYPKSGKSEFDVQFVSVGNYSARNKWSINSTAIFWRNDAGNQVFEVPTSICSKPCAPGSYRLTLARVCCHRCVPCPAGQYSNDTNSNTCFDCFEWEMSNDNKTGCVEKPEEYIRWNDGYGITFIVLTILGVSLTLLTAGVFYRHRHTPVVKASNVQITVILLISLVGGFLSTLFYIGRPSHLKCRGQQIAFELSFTICIASILVKTLRVVTIFNSMIKLSSAKGNKWLGENIQVLIVFLVAFVQVLICVAWMMVAVPKATVDYTPVDRAVVDCDIGSLAFLLCSDAYIVILALLAWILAFRARKLPENFNEAKFITFSMLVFFIFWMSFMPAYISTTGVTATAIHCIGILASSAGILGCIFVPKLYIILITPENNTIEKVRKNNAAHSFQVAIKSLSVESITAQKNSIATKAESISSNESEKRFTARST